MRSALLRLLKRPSAISLLNDLVSTSSGIEQLVAPGKCATCQLRRLHAKRSLHDNANVNHRTDLPQRLQFYDVTRTDHETSRSRSNKQDVSQVHDKSYLPLSLDVDRLEYESALASKEINGQKRLVDDLERKHDFELWKELLQYRKRHYGNQGIAEILKGLEDRVGSIQLPVEGELADYFWETFVNAGLTDEQLLHKVAGYAETIWRTTGKRWDMFYRAIVGGFLTKGLPVQAVSWHRKLQPFHLGDPSDIVSIMPEVMSCTPTEKQDWSSFRFEAMQLGVRAGSRAFGEICLSTEGHKVYEPVISFLLQGGHLLDAIFMHEFLVKQDDLPRNLDTVQQLLTFANNDSHTFSKKIRERIRRIVPSLLSFQDSLAPHSQHIETSQPDQRPQITKNTPHPDDQEGFWDKEKTFSDEFSARLFATKALTVDMITNGLQMFGTPTIGPLSLREIALRADGPRDVLEKIRALRKANITIRDCAFTRLVERLAVEHKDIILEDLLQSDQHPDVLEDIAVQENVLCSYLMARDWRLYNLTKAILSDVAKDDLDNIQFRVYLTAEQFSAASDVVDKMYLDGKTLSEKSITHMMYKILSPRLPGQSPPYDRDGKFNEVDYIARILKLALRSRFQIDPQYWVELLQRLGKHRHLDWEHLREFCLWLAQHYVVQEDSPFLHSLSRSSGVDSETLLAENRAQLRHIFNPRLQMALVTWGFRLALWDEKDYEIPNNLDDGGGSGGMVIRWLRGLLLLRELEAMGVTVYPSFVRKACQERLRVLFGELYSSRRWNRTLREKNNISLSRILDDMLRIYPGLFSEKDLDDINKIIHRPLSGMATRRMEEQLEWLQQWR